MKSNMISENLKKIIYEHDTAMKNGQVRHWSLKIKIYMTY